MSSLWTPDGEHRVPRPIEPSGDNPPRRDRGPISRPEGAPAGAPPGAGKGAPASVDPRPAAPENTHDPELLEELQAMERELAAAPAADIVANHCYGLFQLAALHLRASPPRSDDARIAIDALGAIVEQLGDRLGQAAPSLADALAQIRLAFVQITSPAGTARAPRDSQGQ